MVNKQWDVVLGNPPFQMPKKSGEKNKAKRWVLWHKFVEKSIDIVDNNGIVALITPLSWIAPGKMYNLMTKYKLICVDTTVKKYFPGVGSSFNSFVIQKDINCGKYKTTIFTEDEKILTNLKKLNFLPEKINNISVSIDLKFFNSIDKLKFIRTTEYHTSKKDNFNDGGKIKVFHTNSQTLYSNKIHENNIKHRVALSLTAYPIPKYIHNMGCSQAVIWCEVKNKNEADNLVEVMNSKIFKYIMYSHRWSNWNNLQMFKEMPKLDFTKIWLDEELYEYFGLTQEEIKYIEEFLK